MNPPVRHRPTTLPLHLNGADLEVDLAGVVWWPARRTLIVADLHFEKGTALAARSGQLIPPYDTAATLARLTSVCAAYGPTRVIALGDSFHDPGAIARLSAPDRAVLTGLVASTDWIWVEGNHDPAPHGPWGGTVEPVATLGPLTFRHEAVPGATGEVSGHFHPKAAVRVRDKRVGARCFAHDGARLILPAFGAYTGGLDLLSPDLERLFGADLQASMMGRERLFRFPKTKLIRPHRAPTGLFAPRTLGAATPVRTRQRAAG